MSDEMNTIERRFYIGELFTVSRQSTIHRRLSGMVFVVYRAEGVTKDSAFQRSSGSGSAGPGS